MELKEKIKLLLKEGILTEEEYKSIFPNEEETEENQEVEETEEVEGDAHPNIESDKPTETAEEIAEEAKTETIEDEAEETPQEQASEENALLEEVDNKKEDFEMLRNQIEEMTKANQGIDARVAALEQLMQKIAIPTEPQNVGVGGGGNIGGTVPDDTLHNSIMKNAGKYI